MAMSRNTEEEADEDDEEEEKIKLYRKPRETPRLVNTCRARSHKNLERRHRSEDDIVLSVIKTPLVKNVSPFRRIFSSVDENVDARPEAEPFNASVSIKLRCSFTYLHVCIYTSLQLWSLQKLGV